MFWDDLISPKPASNTRIRKHGTCPINVNGMVGVMCVECNMRKCLNMALQMFENCPKHRSESCFETVGGVLTYVIGVVPSNLEP